MSEPIVMYLFVNTDLNMTKGKIASQVGHAVMVITEEIIRHGYEKYPPPQSYMMYMKWKENCVKIVLRATTDQLKELLKMEEARHIIDNGDTQVPENSLTVVGFFPSNKMGEIVKDYKLL